MEKIVVLSCTNRPDSNTLKVSKIYENLLREKQVEVKILDFCHLPETIAFSETFGNRTEPYARLIEEYISGVSRFVFVVPEYNGSFPGILKTVLESVPTSLWANKEACLVGVADGRAGNLRGLEHLTGILQYLKMHVYHNKLPISVINQILQPEGHFPEAQLRACRQQIEGFLLF
jgi:chromate reductase